MANIHKESSGKVFAKISPKTLAGNKDGDYDSYIDYKDWENELLVIPNSVTDIRKLDRVKVES